MTNDRLESNTRTFNEIEDYKVLETILKLEEIGGKANKVEVEYKVIKDEEEIQEMIFNKKKCE